MSPIIFYIACLILLVLGAWWRVLWRAELRLKRERDFITRAAKATPVVFSLSFVASFFASSGFPTRDISVREGHVVLIFDELPPESLKDELKTHTPCGVSVVYMERKES